MGTGDHRLVALEREVRTEREEAAQHRRVVEAQLSALVEAVNRLVRVEERQQAMHTQMADVQALARENARRIVALEVAMPENADKRLVAIEVKMPGLVEARRYMVAGVAAVVGLIGLTLIGMVVVK